MAVGVRELSNNQNSLRQDRESPPHTRGPKYTNIGQIRGITHVENLNFLSEVSFGTQLIKV